MNEVVIRHSFSVLSVCYQSCCFYHCFIGKETLFQTLSNENIRQTFLKVVYKRFSVRGRNRNRNHSDDVLHQSLLHRFQTHPRTLLPPISFHPNPQCCPISGRLLLLRSDRGIVRLNCREREQYIRILPLHRYQQPSRRSMHREGCFVFVGQEAAFTYLLGGRRRKMRKTGSLSD